MAAKAKELRDKRLSRMREVHDDAFDEIAKGSSMEKQVLPVMDDSLSIVEEDQASEDLFNQSLEVLSEE